MSFSDFSSLDGSQKKPSFSNNFQQQDDGEHGRTMDKIKSSIYAISANVASIQRMVSQLGTQKDTQEMRDKLQNLTHATQQLIKQTTQDVKTLSSLHTEDKLKRLEQQKISKDFQIVLNRFQQIQKLATQKSRESLAKAKAQTHHLEELEQEEPYIENASLLQQEQQRQMQIQQLDHEIEYNEHLIMEREESIVEIEQAIHEVNEIFRDLGSLVNDQQGLIDNIEANIESTAARTGDAVLELQTAERHQKGARNKICFLLGIMLLVLVIVILVVFLKK